MIGWRLTFILYAVGAVLTCAWLAHARKRDADLQRLWAEETRWFTDGFLWAVMGLIWPVVLLDLIRERIVRRPRRHR